MCAKERKKKLKGMKNSERNRHWTVIFPSQMLMLAFWLFSPFRKWEKPHPFNVSNWLPGILNKTDKELLIKWMWSEWKCPLSLLDAWLLHNFPRLLFRLAFFCCCCCCSFVSISLVQLQPHKSPICPPPNEFDYVRYIFRIVRRMIHFMMRTNSNV